MLEDVISLLLISLIIGVSVCTLMWLVRYTDGPLDIFSKFRLRIGYVQVPVYHDFDTIVHIIEEPPDEGFLGLLVDCPWCLSTWLCTISFIWFYFQYNALLVFHAMFVSVFVASASFKWLEKLNG